MSNSGNNTGLTVRCVKEDEGKSLQDSNLQQDATDCNSNVAELEVLEALADFIETPRQPGCRCEMVRQRLCEHIGLSHYVESDPPYAPCACSVLGRALVETLTPEAAVPLNAQVEARQPLAVALWQLVNVQ